MLALLSRWPELLSSVFSLLVRVRRGIVAAKVDNGVQVADVSSESKVRHTLLMQ